MKRPRHPARRIAIKLAVCLLLGAVVTVAVAWRFAVRGSPYASTFVGRTTTGVTWPVPVPPGWPQPWQQSRYRYDWGYFDHWVASSEERPAESMRRFTVEESTLGWPFPALTRFEARAGNFDSTTKTFDSNLEVPALGPWYEGVLWTLTQTRVPRSLPIMPRWLPFLSDTLVFAAPVALLWLGVPAARRWRRRRRGLCPTCGYEVRGLATCPECGSIKGAR